MRYLVWVLRLVVFVVVLLFALKNTEPVHLRFFADYSIANVPLIVVMLISFLLGLLLGLLLMILSSMRKKRDIAKLKREVARLEDQWQRAQAEKNDATIEVIAPLAPL